MNDARDFDLERTPSESSRSTQPLTRPTGFWITVALLIAAITAAAYVAFGWGPLPGEMQSPTSAPTEATK